MSLAPPPAPPLVTRRETIARLAKVGLVLGVSGGVAKLAYDRGGIDVARSGIAPQTRDYSAGEASADLPQMAIARGVPGLDIDPKTPLPPEATIPGAAALVQRAVTAMGGMKRFVSTGDVVVVKPNIGWDRTPAHAANTNPLVIAEVVRLAYDAGAKTVVVTDASCNEPGRCFQRSGIWKAAYDMGADVVLPSEHRFRGMRLGGEVLHEWPVYKALVEADKVINVPVAKHHNLSKYTGAMKNWYGALGGRRNRLHQNIDVSIADLATFMRPTLTIIDATRVLMRNGPQGGNIADARDAHTICASIDQVAADAWGCALVGRRPDEIPYLAMGVARGLGTSDWKSLRVADA
jgi:uncharacterized protein (DUF362 family)